MPYCLEEQLLRVCRETFAEPRQSTSWSNPRDGANIILYYGLSTTRGRSTIGVCEVWYPIQHEPLLHGQFAGASVHALCAEDHGYRRCPDTSCNHALTHLVQPGRRFDLAAVLPADGAAGPENFAGSTGARPKRVVQVRLVNLLAPRRDLAAQDELGLFLRQVRSRVMRVDQPPALGRTAPVVKWVVPVKGLAIFEGKPRTAAAIQVLRTWLVSADQISGRQLIDSYPVVIVAVDDFVALCSKVLDGCTAEPALDDHILANGDVV